MRDNTIRIHSINIIRLSASYEAANPEHEGDKIYHIYYEYF